MNITESITQTYTKSFEVCQSTSDLGNSYNCANEEQCASIGLSVTGASLCCSGGASCFDTSGIIVSPNNDSLSYSFLTDLRCDGAYSCYNGSSYKSNGSLYLTGASSGEESRLLSGKTGVFCRGSYSCTSDTFDVEIIAGVDESGTEGGDVVCSGFESCYDVTIYGARNIYVLAGDGSRGSIFYNTSGDIVCALKRACQATQIKNVGGSVFALGREALGFREIYNVGGNIYAFSWYALKQCEIKNVSGMETFWVVCVCFCLFLFF